MVKRKHDLEGKAKDQESSHVAEQTSSHCIDDLDSYIQEYLMQRKHTRLTENNPCLNRLDLLPGLILARTGHSLVMVDEHTLFLFGGEAQIQTRASSLSIVHFNDLYKIEVSFEPTHKIFKIINASVASSIPLPRTSHQMVFIQDKTLNSFNSPFLFMFGGELGDRRGAQFVHFGDTWLFDIRNNVWCELVKEDDKHLIKSPCPRSGHRMVWCPNQGVILMFGGFTSTDSGVKKKMKKDEGRNINADQGYNPLSTPTSSSKQLIYLNDLWIWSIKTRLWSQIPKTKQNPHPTPRSGCVFRLIDENTLIMHGGYYSDADQGRQLDDTWTLILDSMTWTKIENSDSNQLLSANFFCPRSSNASFCLDKKLFIAGGIVDLDSLPEKKTKGLLLQSESSVLFNDLWMINKEEEIKKWTCLKKSNWMSMSRHSSQVAQHSAFSSIAFIQGGMHEETVDLKKGAKRTKIFKTTILGDLLQVRLNNLNKIELINLAPIMDQSIYDDKDESSSSSSSENDYEKDSLSEESFESKEVSSPNPLPDQSFEDYFEQTRSYWLEDDVEEIVAKEAALVYWQQCLVSRRIDRIEF